MNAQVIKDCSQGFCSFYCPQWCYIIFPPPPLPSPLKDFSAGETSGPDFSPLVITIIGFLAGALLLLSYYAILSNYCRHRFSSSSPSTDQNDHRLDVEAGDPGIDEPWFVAADGLDEAVIGSIATFKYRRREGLVEGTDCSVCLSEFVEDDRLKLLPKCSHAFHVTCIDTWFQCHSNCPLCRAHVAGGGGAISTLPPPPPPPPLPSPPMPRSRGERVENLELVIRDREVGEVSLNAPKRGGIEFEELKRCDEAAAGNGSGDGEGSRRIRRSVSMVDVINRGEEDEMELESNRERGGEVGKLSVK